MRKLGDLHNTEKDILMSIREFSQVYQTYQENFNDSKLEDVKNSVVIPVGQIGQNLLRVYDEMEPTVRSLKNNGIIDES